MEKELKEPSKTRQILNLVKQFLSDCSMGQHYHVLYHKRRSSYASPFCGILTLLLYAAILYYMFIRFKAVIMNEEYTLLEEFRPLSL